MNELILLPNVEALVSAFLRAQPEMIALVDDRVVTALGKDPTWPSVRVNQYGDVPVTTRPLWLAGHLVQVEAWGGSKAEAFSAANTARGLLAGRLEGIHDLGIVTGVEVGGLIDAPDTVYSPAKPRWLFTSTIYAHPG